MTPYSPAQALQKLSNLDRAGAAGRNNGLWLEDERGYFTNWWPRFSKISPLDAAQ